MATLRIRPSLLADEKTAQIAVDLLLQYPRLVPIWSDLKHSPRAWLAGVLSAGLAYDAWRCQHWLGEYFEASPGRSYWPFSIANASGYVVDSPETNSTLFAIAGSNDPDDWLVHNCDSRLVEWRDLPGRVAHGFAEHAELVLRDFDFEKRPYNPQRRFVFVGHSLGAAVAQLLAAYFGAAGFRTSAIAVASPRVGNRQWGNWFAKHVRAVHLWARGDLVPLAHPIVCGYRHAPIAHRFLGSDGTIYRTRMAVASDLVGLPLLRLLNIQPACMIATAKRSHRITTYIDRLAAFVRPEDMEPTQ